VGVVAVGILVAAGAYGLWYLFLRPSGPPPVDIGSVPLPSATILAGASTAPSGAGATDAPAASAGSSSGSSGSSASTSAGGSGLDGTWTVNTSLGSFSDFTSSFVGYRVQEQLASIGANTAVGRTPNVSGSITIQGTTVTAGDFTADLTTLQSDDQRRDGQLRNQGIQTSQFPNATFKLTSPIDFGSVPADGQAVTVNATGDFTLHGVAKSVTIPLQAKRSGDEIVVTGSTTIQFSDYDITKPNSFAVLSIEDNGVMEFQLLFTKS
jgi:polyisoprenoid-binding protein YceI